MRKAVQLAFDAGLVLKALDGILEIIGGILLSLTTSGDLNHWVRFLTQHDLDGDADDIFVKFFIHALQHRTASTQAFATAFLIGHGVVKVSLVAALLKQYRWAYPAAIAIFGAFLAYQIYRFSLTHALWLLALSAIDSIVIVIAWLEYRRLRRSER